MFFCTSQKNAITFRESFDVDFFVHILEYYNDIKKKYSIMDNGGVSIMTLYLSKSKYRLGLQCPRMLWLNTHQSNVLRASSNDDAAMEFDNEVIDLAKKRFGKVSEVPYSVNLQEMLDETQSLIAGGIPVISGAAFTCQDSICRVDMLKDLGNQAVELYGIKSSTDIKDSYFEDIAFQCHVLLKLGYNVCGAYLIHINNQYVRHGDLDLDQLFVTRDITEKVLDMQEPVQDTIDELNACMNGAKEPKADIGAHCFSPCECEFLYHCAPALPNPSVFDLAGMRRSKKLRLYHEGCISFAQLQQQQILSHRQRLQVEHELLDSPPHIDKREIQSFLSGLSYPLYFLDFESIQPAIPPYDNSSPYEKIAFQYSLHYIEQEDGEVKHKEFLAYPGQDPRFELAKSLCDNIPLNSCVLAYNMAFEKGRIRNLAKICPELYDHLMNIHDNIRDLMIPFRKCAYYDKAMNGSYSIKAVLPAMFPNDPDLDYHNLSGVHNGLEASDTFMRMQNMGIVELEENRRHLLAYCGLDTWGMVKIWQKLKETAK